MTGKKKQKKTKNDVLNTRSYKTIFYWQRSNNSNKRQKREVGKTTYRMRSQMGRAAIYSVSRYKTVCVRVEYNI